MSGICTKQIRPLFYLAAEKSIFPLNLTDKRTAIFNYRLALLLKRIAVTWKLLCVSVCVCGCLCVYAALWLLVELLQSFAFWPANIKTIHLSVSFNSEHFFIIHIKSIIQMSFYPSKLHKNNWKNWLNFCLLTYILKIIYPSSKILLSFLLKNLSIHHFWSFIYLFLPAASVQYYKM